MGDGESVCGKMEESVTVCECGGGGDGVRWLFCAKTKCLQYSQFFLLT